MQSKSTINHQRKRLVNKFTKYKEVNPESVKVDLILGESIHRADITFKDGNRLRWSLRVTENNIVISKPRMWEYPMEKLAVMDYLTATIFSNDTYTIIEDRDLHQPNRYVDQYKIQGEISTAGTVVYCLATDVFHESHFIDYDIRILSKQAKTYKFPMHNI
jgi:hypothetical protein